MLLWGGVGWDGFLFDLKLDDLNIVLGLLRVLIDSMIHVNRRFTHKLSKGSAHTCRYVVTFSAKLKSYGKKKGI